jgi:hypothetical protein
LRSWVWTSCRKPTSSWYPVLVRSSASCLSRSSWLKSSPVLSGKYVSLKDTIAGFKGILNGDYDHLPEQAFYMVGGIEEAIEKAKKL